MTREPDPSREWIYVDDLMSSEDICKLLDLNHTSALHNIRRRAKERGAPFPEPLKATGNAAIWARPPVVTWAVQHGYLEPDGETFRAHPRAGRPRKL